MYRFVHVCVSVAAFLAAPILLPAQQTIVVTGGGPALQNAIISANPGDRLDVFAGTYSAVLVDKGIYIDCRAGVRVYGNGVPALTAKAVPGNQLLRIRGGEFLTSKSVWPTFEASMRVDSNTGSVVLESPKLPLVSVYNTRITVINCSGTVVVRGVDVGSAIFDTSPFTVIGSARVVFEDCANLTPVGVRTSNLILRNCRIRPANSTKGFSVKSSKVSVQGGRIEGGVMFSLGYGLPAISMSSGELTLTDGAVIAAYTLMGSSDSAISTSGGTIRLDPSVQLISSMTNPISGPAIVTNQIIPSISTSFSGRQLTSTVRAEPFSVTGTFVSWSVIPFTSPFGPLWVDFTAPILDLATMPASGSYSFTGTVPVLPPDTLIVLQPISVTRAGALVTGAPLHLLFD